MFQSATLHGGLPELPADLKSGGILIFAKTSGFRDEAGIQASNAALAAIAQEHGWQHLAFLDGNNQRLLSTNFTVQVVSGSSCNCFRNREGIPAGEAHSLGSYASSMELAALRDI